MRFPIFLNEYEDQASFQRDIEDVLARIFVNGDRQGRLDRVAVLRRRKKFPPLALA